MNHEMGLCLRTFKSDVDEKFYILKLLCQIKTNNFYCIYQCLNNTQHLNDLFSIFGGEKNFIINIIKIKKLFSEIIFLNYVLEE